MVASMQVVHYVTQFQITLLNWRLSLEFVVIVAIIGVLQSSIKKIVTKTIIYHMHSTITSELTINHRTDDSMIYSRLRQNCFVVAFPLSSKSLNLMPSPLLNHCFQLFRYISYFVCNFSYLNGCSF